MTERETERHTQRQSTDGYRQRERDRDKETDRQRQKALWCFLKLVPLADDGEVCQAQSSN